MFVILELPRYFFSAPENLLLSTRPDSHKLRPLLISRPLYHASSSKASRLDGLSSPQAQASGDAKRALFETSVQAVVVVTAELRAMAAAMAAANATVMAAMTVLAAVMATASDSCVEGICVFDAAAGAMTVASTTAVKAAAR
jgi:hypothetical protein